MYGSPSWIPLCEFPGVLCCLHYHMLTSHCSVICLWWCPSFPKLHAGFSFESNTVGRCERGCWKDRLRVAETEGRDRRGLGSRLGWWTAPPFWTQCFGGLLGWFLLPVPIVGTYLQQGSIEKRVCSSSKVTEVCQSPRFMLSYIISFHPKK